MRRALIAAAVLVAAAAAPVQASPPPPAIDATAWYLEGHDGAFLAGRNERDRRPQASITKLMTAVVTLAHAAPSDVVTVSPRAARVGGSTVYLRAGERLTVAQLLRAMLVPSANDAAFALALHVGKGSIPRFVELMNAKARELGLADTSYRNPHGLDEVGHVSSARDATLLLRYALGIPFVRDALGRTTVSLPGGRTFPTTDDLLAEWPPLVAGKTGHTVGAGWSEAAAASGRGATVYGAVLGSDSRTSRNAALRTLLAHGLDRYRRVSAIDTARTYALAVTGYGRAEVALVARRSFRRTVRADVPLVERVYAPESVGLPVRAGDELGRVEIWDGSRLVASSSLVAATDVDEPDALGKAAWYLETTLENLWELLT